MDRKTINYYKNYKKTVNLKVYTKAIKPQKRISKNVYEHL